MARSYSARESQASINSLLAGLSQSKLADIRDGIFFDVNRARAAAFKGYKGPQSKNSYGWFTEEAETATSKMGKDWAAKQADILGRLWDVTRKQESDGPYANSRMPQNFIEYPDRQTFIDRHMRFVGDDYKRAVAYHLEQALKPAHAVEKFEGKGLIRPADFPYNKPKEVQEVMREWNSIAAEGEKQSARDAYNFLKSRI